MSLPFEADDRWLDTDEVGAVVRAARRTVEHWRETGDGPAFYKLRGRIYYRLSDVTSWIAQRRVSTRDSDTPDNWGEREREYVARRAEAGTRKGEAYAAYLERLPPVEAADEVGAIFALCATEDLAGEIANDLQLDPEKAELIAQEIATSRRRIKHATATRPIRPVTAAEG